MSNDTFEAFFVNENEKVKNSCPLGVKLPSRVYRYCKYAYISIYLENLLSIKNTMLNYVFCRVFNTYVLH